MRKPPQAYINGFCSIAQSERWYDALILLSEDRGDGMVDTGALVRAYPNTPTIHDQTSLRHAAHVLGCSDELEYLTGED